MSVKNLVTNHPIQSLNILYCNKTCKKTWIILKCELKYIINWSVNESSETVNEKS